MTTTTHRPWLCPICNRRPLRVGCVTCGNSFCQEASYASNMLFAQKRLSRTARKTLENQRDRATDAAHAWGRSR